MCLRNKLRTNMEELCQYYSRASDSNRVRTSCVSKCSCKSSWEPLRFISEFPLIFFYLIYCPCFYLTCFSMILWKPPLTTLGHKTFAVSGQATCQLISDITSVSSPHVRLASPLRTRDSKTKSQARRYPISAVWSGGEARNAGRSC